MKNDKCRLFIKCILAALPFLLFMAYVRFFPMNYLVVEYPMWAWQKDVTKGASDDGPDTLVLGDSRAQAGLMPALMEGSAYNLSLTGASPIEMYYALERYLEHCGEGREPEQVVVIFAPFHYMFTDNFWERTIYFDYLSVTDAMQVLGEAKDSGDASIVREGQDVYLEYLSYKLRLPGKYLPAVLNARVLGRGAENREKYAAIEKDRGYSLIGTMDGCDWPNFETNYEHFTPSVMLDDYFRRLLALCDREGIQVYVEQAPMNRASYDVLHDSFVEEYRIYMEEIAAQFPEAMVQTELSAYDNKYFGDESHLNGAGAQIFTQYIGNRYITKEG